MAKLVGNWKGLHKSSTVILSVIGVVISLSDLILTNLGLIKSIIPEEYYSAVMFGLTMLIGICRYIKQDSLVPASPPAAIEADPPITPQE